MFDLAWYMLLRGISAWKALYQLWDSADLCLGSNFATCLLSTFKGLASAIKLSHLHL